MVEKTQEHSPVAIKRKCHYCKEIFYIDTDNISEAIYFDKSTYHLNCFTSYCEECLNKSNKNTFKKWMSVRSNIKDIYRESYNHFENEIYKNKILELIRDFYEITVIPSTVYVKLASIYSGEYKGLSKGIPPEYLYDMWTQKKTYLQKIYISNFNHGKRMNTVQRIYYDLAILVNKYDSYLNWRKMQSLTQIKNNNVNSVLNKQVNNFIKDLEKAENERLSAKCSYKSTNDSIEDIENNDISNLVNDIFEE